MPSGSRPRCSLVWAPSPSPTPPPRLNLDRVSGVVYGEGRDERAGEEGLAKRAGRLRHDRPRCLRAEADGIDDDDHDKEDAAAHTRFGSGRPPAFFVNTRFGGRPPARNTRFGSGKPPARTQYSIWFGQAAGTHAILDLVRAGRRHERASTRGWGWGACATSSCSTGTASSSSRVLVTALSIGIVVAARLPDPRVSSCVCVCWKSHKASCQSRL